MIISDLNVYRVAFFPRKANAPLVIYADAIVPRPITGQFFQPVRRGDAKIINALCIINHTQLSQGNLLNIGRQFP